MDIAASPAQGANLIDAHIEFSFKGETYSLTSTLDLDRMLDKYIEPPSLHHVLAVEHGINTYSYLYEVMEVEEIEFDNPKGLAVQFLHDGVFDLEGFAAHWGESHRIAPLQIIAQQEMGIEDLDRHPQLRSALLRAYQLGVEA